MGLVSADRDAEKRALRDMGLDALDKVTEVFAHYLLSYMPKEDGHGHEAFATAMEKVPLPATSRVPDQYAGTRSGDPTAKQHGHAGYSNTDAAVSVSLEASLPFLHKLETGGTIRVGDMQGNKGAKEGGASTAGQLYAPRMAGTSGRLFWRDAQGIHTAKTRNITPGLKFMANAANQARLKAKQLGLKRRR